MPSSQFKHDIDLILYLKKTIIKAGSIAKSRQNNIANISYKKDKSPVTEIDIEISKFIESEILKLAMPFPIISEENNITNVLSRDLSRNFWLIDPIDGTKSYVKGERNYAINIALIKDHKPYIGLIYQPANAELYIARVPEKKIYIEKNGDVLGKHSFSHAGLIALTSKRYKNNKTLAFLKRYDFSKIAQISSAVKLCMIASGEADVHPRFGKTMEWDTAAGHALILASGGDIITPCGHRLEYGKPGFANQDFIAYGTKFKPFLDNLPLKAS